VVPEPVEGRARSFKEVFPRMKKNCLLIIFLLTCCAPTRHEITLKTVEIGSAQGLSAKIYPTKNFQIFTLQKITNRTQPLHVYIEGDGRAFINRNLVSSNPTPTSFFLINLIKEDAAKNILYIARPCQYVDLAIDKKCEEKFWTTARFSAQVIDSIDEVLENFAEYKLELIGYSGGGAVAEYIAERRKNIISFRTIAGNLDHQKFTEIHHVSKLDQSLTNQNLQALAAIPQIHFVGEKDKIIPRIVAESYVEKLPKKNCVKIVNVDEASHFKGWQGKWRDFLQMKIGCTKS